MRALLALLLWLSVGCADAQMLQSIVNAPKVAPSCTFPRIDFTTGSLGTASLTRASSGTYINVSGVLTTASTNVARFNYDKNYPGGGAAPSLTGPFLLIEPAATNVLKDSNTFNTNWSGQAGSTVSSAAFTSPDGTVDGWSLTVGSGFGGIVQSATATAVTYTESAFGNQLSGGTPLGMQIAAAQSGHFTLSGTTTRFSFQATGNAGATSIFLYAANGAGSNPIGIYAAQLEVAAATGYFATNPSSYIATTSAAASRSADVVTFTQPTGCGHNTYTFDDNSTQSVSQAAGSATVPTNLNRANLKFIDGSA